MWQFVIGGKNYVWVAMWTPKCPPPPRPAEGPAISVKKYMDLVVQSTYEPDRKGKLVKQLGLFAELGLLRKQQLRKAGTRINGPRNTSPSRRMMNTIQKAVILILTAILIQIQITNILLLMALLSNPWVL